MTGSATSNEIELTLPSGWMLLDHRALLRQDLAASIEHDAPGLLEDDELALVRGMLDELRAGLALAGLQVALLRFDESTLSREFLTLATPPEGAVEAFAASSDENEPTAAEEPSRFIGLDGSWAAIHESLPANDTSDATSPFRSRVQLVMPLGDTRRPLIITVLSTRTDAGDQMVADAEALAKSVRLVR